jgi:uncharacterized protein (TIGR02444 family)
VSESGLWRFSLAFYRRPGVADACIRLQDEAGVDVNVMLYLLYLAARGKAISAAEMSRIEAVAADWRSAVVVPLREIRRKLKSPLGVFAPAVTAELRNDVKRIELGAERIQQQALENLIALDAEPPEHGDRRNLARANMARYRARLGALPEEPLDLILEAFAQYREPA